MTRLARGSFSDKNILMAEGVIRNRRPPHAGTDHQPPTPRPDDRDVESDPDISAVRGSLGQTIRELRQQRRLSGRALAKQARVTSGFISQLENGLVTPSLATLLRIASALDVRIGELFTTPIATGQVLRRHERTHFDYPDLGVRDEIISSDPSEKLEVLLGCIAPGGGSGGELYTHGADTEFVLVLEGTIELHLAQDTYILEEGDSITFSGDIPHGYANSTDETTRLLWVMTPVSY